MCTSSSARFHVNRPSRISFPISFSPDLICRRSLPVMIPARASASACATDPRISCAYSRQSNETDSPNRLTRSLVDFWNRPFHIPGL